MGDIYRRSKTYRYDKDTPDDKTKSNRPKYSSHKRQESRTPPLPSSTSTLKYLIKTRETLKNELKKIVQTSNSEASKPQKRKHSRKDGNYESKSKMTKTHERKPSRRRKSGHASSPEIVNTRVDSEDEEVIIELQRQKRKKLLEKLTVTDGNKCDSYGITTMNNLTKNRKTDDSKTSNTHKGVITKKATDMFSEVDEFDKSSIDNVPQMHPKILDDCDDEEGYYNVRVGDVLKNRYTVKGLLGQGVFANVVRAQDNIEGNNYFAIKIVRNNDLMYRTSLKEISILKEIAFSDPENKYHCVKYIDHFMHRDHLCILLESLHMDLRHVIKKYGKHCGLNLKALISYSRQLLSALRLLKKIGIIHADIKPDNILVNEKKNILKLCDFGSAAKLNDNEPTPYLVSRFYRAPEIILGVPYSHGVDIWSAACTMFEMATGKIMFTGNTNNKMLKCFMDIKGRFSSRFIRRGKFKDQHFNYNNNFLYHKKDEFTGRDKVVEMNNVVVTRDIYYEIKKAYKTKYTTEDDKKIFQMKELIDKMLIVDPSQRLSITDCLKHPFISEDSMKDKT